jgi:hypothetical protein
MRTMVQTGEADSCRGSNGVCSNCLPPVPRPRTTHLTPPPTPPLPTHPPNPQFTTPNPHPSPPPPPPTPQALTHLVHHLQVSVPCQARLLQAHVPGISCQGGIVGAHIQHAGQHVRRGEAWGARGIGGVSVLDDLAGCCTRLWCTHAPYALWCTHGVCWRVLTCCCAVQV